MSRNDMLNSFRETLEAAKAEVRAEGLAEGHAEGEAAKAREIAARLMAKGMTKAEAAELVGLSEADLDVTD
ncbi:MAG: hypothetical protein IJX67_03425 [Oscillospiraceae bacterium]|nr:hypothetical protein [Oscillospiraceae bacterium]